MSYCLHISKGNSPWNMEAIPITLQEIEELAKNNQNLKLVKSTEKTYTTSKGEEVSMMPEDICLVFTFKGEDYFFWYDDSKLTGDYWSIDLKWFLDIAKKLNARVFGDEGEEFFIDSNKRIKSFQSYSTIIKVDDFYLRGHIDEIHSMNLSKNGKLLLSASKDNTINMWNIEKGKLLNTFKWKYDPEIYIRFDANEECIITNSGVVLYNLDDFKNIKDNKKELSLKQVILGQSSKFGKDVQNYAATLMSEDSELYKRELLNTRNLDFSLKSIEEIQKYLNSIKNDKLEEKQFEKLSVLCGLYIGKVIACNIKGAQMYWLSHDSACKFKKYLTNYDKSFTMYAVLATKNSISLPIYEVVKYLENKTDKNSFELQRYVQLEIDIVEKLQTNAIFSRLRFLFFVLAWIVITFKRLKNKGSP